MFSPLLNIVAGVGVLAAIRYEMRKNKNEKQKFIFVIDMFAGLVLFTEGVNILHPGKIIQPGVFYMAAAIIVVIKGMFQSKIGGLRHIRFDEKGFYARTSLFHKRSLEWKNISEMKFGTSLIQLYTNKASTIGLNLRRYENRDEIVDAFTGIAKLHSIKTEIQ